MNSRRAKVIRRQISALAAQYHVKEDKVLTVTTMKDFIKNLWGKGRGERMKKGQVRQITRWSVGKRRLYQLCKRSWERNNAHRMATAEEYWTPLRRFATKG